MTMPQPTRLFHITAIENLGSILAAGQLHCKNYCQAQQVSYTDIAHGNIQQRRAVKRVPISPYGVVHDYVPFYFAPRSPMLFAINGGYVKGCNLTQKDIVHLETTVTDVMNFQPPIVFTDRNASMAYTNFDSNLRELGNLVSWDLITASPNMDGFCKYWHDDPANGHPDRKERRQAEFLVHQQVPISVFKRIGVYNHAALTHVRHIVQQAGLNLPVTIMPDWYF